MASVRLSRDDAEFLLGRVEEVRLREKLQAAVRGQLLDEDTADELRDICADMLLEEGFDEDYRPNEQGRRLEQLIDELHVP